MDDRLQRRLRDADPLTAAAGLTPDPERLDAIKERIMQTETHVEPAAGRSHLRPRALGLTALAATAMVAILVIGTLARPSSAVLAWDPSPTAVSADQRAAATAACAAGLPPVTGAPGVSAQDVVVDGATVTSGGGAVTDDGGIVPFAGDGGPVPSLPSLPAALPPLVTLELHGSGGVAVFADDAVTAYCLLVKDGDRLVSGGLMFPDLGGATVGVGTIGAATAEGSSSGMVQAIAADGWLLTRMRASYRGQLIGIIAGEVPAGAATVAVTGGAADGAAATVTQGRFALWAPGGDAGEDVTITALDAAGGVIGVRSLAPPPDAPIVATTAAP
jgi:hypothetical protein